MKNFLAWMRSEPRLLVIVTWFAESNLAVPSSSSTPLRANWVADQIALVDQTCWLTVIRSPSVMSCLTR